MSNQANEVFTFHVSRFTLHVSRQVRRLDPFCTLLAFILLVSWGGKVSAAPPSAVAAGVDETQRVVAAHYERGMHDIEMGLYDQAIAEFQSILQLQPSHAEAHCQLGAAYRLKDMLNEAADAYQHALTLRASKQTHGIANLCLGMIYNTQGKFLRAEKYGEAAVALLPEMAEAHYRLGDIYTQRGKLAEAIRAYQKSIQLNPALVESYQGLGRVALMQNRVEEAISYYQEAIQRGPYEPSSYYNLAKAYRRLHRLEEAKAQMATFEQVKAYQDMVQHYRKGLQENPTDVRLHTELAETHLEVGNLEAAIGEYKIATTLDPTFVIGYNNLGSLYMQQGEFQQAIEAFQRVIQLDASAAEPYVSLGWLYARQGKFDLAKSHLQSAIQRNPKLTGAYQGLGEIYVQQRDLKNAIATYTRLTEVQPQESGAWLRLGVLQLNAKQVDAAIHAFQRAIEVDANAADAYNNLAWLYADLSVNLESAVELARKAVALNPAASNFDTLAYAYYKNKQYQEAESAIRRALEIDPKNQNYQKRLAEIRNANDTKRK